MITSSIQRLGQVWRNEGGMAVIGRVMMFLPLRLRLHVWLPLAYRLGIPTPLKLPDRTFLEQGVFGWLSRQTEVKTVLFAGVESYTWHYYRFFRKDQNFLTIDFSEKQAMWGRKGHHVVGSVTELDRYYEPEQFDALIFNGLIGWGLDQKAEIEASFEQAYRALKPGGIFIVGWPNEPKFIQFPLSSLKGYQLFEPFVPEIDGVKAASVEVSPWRRHTFDFLRKA